ncbi:hypothetical protein [Paenibacillus prosopidis]|uniref:hypothetical protein n=1 Tax=Paenibacillus prosopidis TaxID=630520 RepID=UPI0011C06F4A|nr:hypothetical protein [Paenibacillus prosopidis]
MKKTPPRPIVKPNGGKSFTAYSGANKQAAMIQDLMKPTLKVNTSQSKAKKQAGKPLFQAAKGVYNFFIGDNIKTLRNPNASLLAKSVAAIDLIGMAIPGGLLVKSGATLAIKGAIEAAKYLKEPAKAIARAAKKKATEAVDKAWGFAKGLFGSGKKSKITSSKTGSLKLDLQMFASNKRTGKFANKNSNNYVGHQGVYEIKIDGNLHKYGKADMTKLANTGNPKTLKGFRHKLINYKGKIPNHR